MHIKDSCIPKALLYGQLQQGSHNVERPRLRFKDTLNKHLQKLWHEPSITAVKKLTKSQKIYKTFPGRPDF